MKTCPNCKMITDSYSECIVCGHNVIDEPHMKKKCEKYVLNKYFLPYLFKKHRFALICLLLSFVAVAVSIKNINTLVILSISASGITLVLFLFKNDTLFILENAFRKKVAAFVYRLALYGFGAYSIFRTVTSILYTAAVWASTQEPVYL